MVALRQSSRLALLRVSPEFLVKIAMEGAHAKVSARGLPADAEVIGSSYDPNRNCFCVAIRSESFAEVPSGALIPPLPDPQFQDV